jgi:hypothetical protein
MEKFDLFINELKTLTDVQRDFTVKMLSFAAKLDGSKIPSPVESNQKHGLCDTNNQFEQVDYEDFGEPHLDIIENFKKKTYPYNKFIDDLDGPSSKNIKKEYIKFKKMANGMDPVAYYLFENRELSDGVRKQFIRVFMAFNNTKMDYNPIEIKRYLVDLDIQESMTHSTLSLYYTKLIQIGVTSYGFDVKDFPKIKFASKKTSNERRHAAVNKELVLQAIHTLENKGHLEYGLLLKLMWTFAARPSEMLYL